MLVALGPLEKGAAYYRHNHLFLTKMAQLGLILMLELSPMVTLMRWRRSTRRGERPGPSVAPRLARIRFLQAGLVVLMVLGGDWDVHGDSASSSRAAEQDADWTE